MSKRIIFLLALSFSLLTITSCEECRGLLGGDKVPCSNGGSCNDGECDCLKGYAGSSCEEVDSCDLLDVTCVRGYCETGNCFCDSGFEGEDCSIESRKKFLGTYNVIERCPDLDTTWGYNIVVERNILDGAVVNITNLFSFDNYPINGYFSIVEATADQGAESFTIKNQKPDDGEKGINGSGSISVVDSVTNINIIYTTTNGGKTFNCSCEGNRIGD